MLAITQPFWMCVRNQVEKGIHLTLTKAEHPENFPTFAKVNRAIHIKPVPHFE